LRSRLALNQSEKRKLISDLMNFASIDKKINIISNLMCSVTMA